MYTIPMRRLGRRLVIALVSASAVIAGAGVIEDHHEHAGLTDADPFAEGHHHGDADDHHDGPDSPCHHHVFHCGCTALGAMATEPAGAAIELGSARCEIADVTPHVPPRVHLLLHVPLV
jgi:hypothetical protein